MALRHPYVAFAMLYTFIFIYAFSTFGNFGIITRQRVQLYPLVLVFVLSFWAAIEQLVSFAEPGNADWLLFALDVIIIVASVWVAIEAVQAMRRALKDPPEPEHEDSELVAVREQV